MDHTLTQRNEGCRSDTRTTIEAFRTWSRLWRVTAFQTTFPTTWGWLNNRTWPWLCGICEVLLWELALHQRLPHLTSTKTDEVVRGSQISNHQCAAENCELSKNSDHSNRSQRNLFLHLQASCAHYNACKTYRELSMVCFMQPKITPLVGSKTYDR